MNHQWDMFQRGLDRENFDKAQAIYQKLAQEHHAPKQLKIDTRKIYENQFFFPEVAKNDIAVGALDKLEMAQMNLNNNMENPELFKNFVNVAQDTTEFLLKQYPDYWSDPSTSIKKTQELNQ